MTLSHPKYGMFSIFDSFLECWCEASFYVVKAFIYYLSSGPFLPVKYGCRSVVEYHKTLKQCGTLNLDGLIVLFITCLYNMPCDHVPAVCKVIFNGMKLLLMDFYLF